MQARYHDPVIGRFYSNDPVGYIGKNPVMSFNRYLYVNNNPYKYTEPNGELLQFIVIGIIAIAGIYTVDRALDKIKEVGKPTTKELSKTKQRDQSISNFLDGTGSFADMVDTEVTKNDAHINKVKKVGEAGAAAAAPITTLGIPTKPAELDVAAIDAAKTLIDASIEEKSEEKL